MNNGLEYHLKEVDVKLVMIVAMGSKNVASFISVSNVCVMI